MESDGTGCPGFSFDKSQHHENGNFLDRTPGLDAQDALRRVFALIEVSHKLGHILGHEARHFGSYRMLLLRIIINRFPYLGFRQGNEFRPRRRHLKYMGVFSPRPALSKKNDLPSGLGRSGSLQPYKNGAAYSRERYCIPLPARP
jgi:hypothetical protein